MTNPQPDLWYGTSGPPDAKIVLVAESWGEEELHQKRPLVGTSGREQDRILADAGLKRDDILCTNVVAAKPQGNETWRFFLPKEQKPHRIGGLAPSPLVMDEARRLYCQLGAYKRTLVIAAGAYPLWALSSTTGATVKRESNNRRIPPELQTWEPTGIMNWRGSMWHIQPHPEFINDYTQDQQLQNTKLLPIIHPAAVLRQWAYRAPTVQDLRARVPLAISNDWRKDYEFWAPPTFQQALNKLHNWYIKAEQAEEVWLSCDIETARGLITCLGFSDDPYWAMSIPFIRRTVDGGFASWWAPDQEAQLLWAMIRLFKHPNTRIIGQNFIYDTQYIQHFMGVTPRLAFDTMLAQNVMFPGTPKALEYLSSLYCRHHWFWKEDHKEWDLSGTIEDLLRYNCLDCCRTYEVMVAQRQLLRHLNMLPQMAFKMKTNDFCLRMMNRGVKIDTARKGRLSQEMHDALQGLYADIEAIIPQEMVEPGHKTRWYRSATQTRKLFYEILGFKTINNRKTGNPTVGKEALMELKKRHPEFSRLFNLLRTAGSVETEISVLNTAIDPDGRMRCSFNPGGTETHRLSSSTNAFGRGTNLQNLTKGEEDE